MAKKSRASFDKRQKELARQEKQKTKQARRLERKQKKDGSGPDEDPDLAGIEPGPQPPPEEP